MHDGNKAVRASLAHLGLEDHRARLLVIVVEHVEPGALVAISPGVKSGRRSSDRPASAGGIDQQLAPVAWLTLQ